jgi:hypothetical protein
MIADAELALDQIRDPRAGPEWRFIAEFLRAFQQPIHQVLTLPGIEHGQPARPSGCFQPLLALLGYCPYPSTHCLAAHLNPTRHLTLIQALP